MIEALIDQCVGRSMGGGGSKELNGLRTGIVQWG